MHRGIFSARSLEKTRVRGLTLFALLAIVAASSAAQSTFKLLHTFSGSDGNAPAGNLVLDAAGNLYGVTTFGGVTCPDDTGYGCGTLFRITPSRAFSVLHKFAGGAAGEFPAGGLTADSTGVIFGTTLGASKCRVGMPPGTCGSIFKFSSAGGFVLLHNFRPYLDGVGPYGTLTLDAKGNIYGTTSNFGPHSSPRGLGTVFQLNPAGALKVLHTFLGSTTGDGSAPEGRVLLDSAGNIYGTTIQGGLGCAPQGCGTVFKIDSAGKETIVANFSSPTAWTVGPSLVGDSTGNLFGTTYFSAGCCGSVFEINGAGVETILHDFANKAKEGSAPMGLVRDAAGNFYGAAQAGGLYGYGTVFKIDTAGKETTLYNFTGGADGAYPPASVILDSKGNLYGTSSQSGLNPALKGTVFKLSLP